MNFADARISFRSSRWSKVPPANSPTSHRWSQLSNRTSLFLSLEPEAKAPKVLKKKKTPDKESDKGRGTRTGNKSHPHLSNQRPIGSVRLPTSAPHRRDKAPNHHPLFSRPTKPTLLNQSTNEPEKLKDDSYPKLQQIGKLNQIDKLSEQNQQNQANQQWWSLCCGG